MIANYTTTVPVDRTLAAITAMLVSAGATNVTQHIDGGAVVGIEFGITTQYGWRPYRLPVRIEAVRAVLLAAGPAGMKPSYRTPEHAARVAWRIAHDWLRAQVALIEAGMASMDEVMFPYVLVDASHTAFEMYAQRELAQ